MLDDQSGAGICVIDLNTVVPGLLHYDFGDAIRTITNTAAEATSPKSISTWQPSPPICKAIEPRRKIRRNAGDR
jgi:hypothetical protein